MVPTLLLPYQAQICRKRHRGRVQGPGNDGGE